MPGHFLGRLGKALSCYLLDKEEASEEKMQLVGLAPGPLGIASALCGFIDVSNVSLAKVCTACGVVCAQLQVLAARLEAALCVRLCVCVCVCVCVAACLFSRNGTACQQVHMLIA